MNKQENKITNQQVYRWLADHKKTAVGAVAGVFFLFVLFAVPAGRIPFLSRAAAAMGFTSEETGRYSFGRALLTWTTDGAKRWLSDEEGEGILARGNASRVKERNEGGARSGLLNIRAVNASLSRGGKQPDAVKGSSFGLPGTDGDRPNQVEVNRPISGWTQDAQQAIRAQGSKEVYFGEVNGARAAGTSASGAPGSADSSKMLKKDGRVVGSVKSDPLGSWVDKALSRSTKPIEEELKKKGANSSSLLNLNVEGQGMRDLEHVLITSKAGERAPQIVLKKTLAQAGFTNAEIPQKIFDGAGSTVAPKVDDDAVVKDVSDTKLQLQREEKCRKSSSVASDTLGPALSSARQISGQLAGQFPKNCTDTAGINAWNSGISRLKQICATVQGVYRDMQSTCGLGVKSNGTCELNTLEANLSDFLAQCTVDPEATPNLDAVSKDVNQSFNIPVGDSDEIAPNANDFFPESQLGTSQFL